MSIKDLFNNYSKKRFQSSITEQSASNIVESFEFVKERDKEDRRYIPIVDFSTASNFAKFGSAELYYEYAFKRIYEDYPFDGTLAEKVAFNNNSTMFDKYIFDHVYPRTNGHVKFSPTGWTAQLASDDGYGRPTTKQYIYVQGGPHTASGGMTGKKLADTFNNSMYYDPSKRQGSSLEWNPLSGSTIEFWMKKKEFLSGSGTGTGKEVLFDLWNGRPHAAGDYGRIRLELSASTYGNGPLRLTVQSGSKEFLGLDICPSTLTTASVADDKWHHYAVTIQSTNSPSDLTTINLYRDGKYLKTTTDTSIYLNNIEQVSTGLVAAVGALVTSSAHNTADTGWGKLSASLDEFRYWKKARTTNQIGDNWFSDIGGGNNYNEANKHLGVYFKFNEGITGQSKTDSKVLDYSGRIAHGRVIGYQSEFRLTSSAFVESGVALKEFQDPIMYSFHPDVSSKLTMLKASGSVQDFRNSSLMTNLMPSWIIEEDELNGKNLKFLNQIMASYFDELYAQISGVLDLKSHTFFSGSHKPNTLIRQVLRSKGFVMPDIFVDETIIERFKSRDVNEIYSENINDIKNLIYQNIYNNLEYIYKTKGTEKSFRNFFRCFGFDSELVKLNMYADDATYVYQDNIELSSVQKKIINFDDVNNLEAVVVTSGSHGTGTYSINGATTGSAFTLEGEVIFPRKKTQQDVGYYHTSFLTSSLFGLQLFNRKSNLSVKALRPEVESKDVEFAVFSGSTEVIRTDMYSSVYDHEKWNLSLSLRHKDYPYLGINTSSAPSYILEFNGYNSHGNFINNSFSITSSLTDPADAYGFLTSSKGVFAGAHYEDLSNLTILKDRTDVLMSQVRYWNSYLTKEELKYHSFNPDNYGVLHPLEPDSPKEIEGKHVPKSETLVLHWDFFNVSASSGGGDFEVIDMTSGSDNFVYNYGYLNNIAKNSHYGKGKNFYADSTEVARVEHIVAAKPRLPDVLYTSDGVSIKSNDVDEVFFEDEETFDNFFMFEKSPYGVISEKMLNMFAGVKDFNNLIGRPVNRYRESYKDLKALADLYFKDVQNVPDPYQFFEYFKWIDDSISFALQQLVPANSRYSDKIRNIVESHILERNKFREKINQVARLQSTEGKIKGAGELTYRWKTGHSPIETTATATITIHGASGISNGDTFTLVDSNGTSTIYTINTGVAPADGGGSGGNVNVGFSGVGGGSSGKIAGAAAMVIAINNTTDANYSAVSDGVDTVTITQGGSGDLGNRINSDSIGSTTVSNFTGGDSKQGNNCAWQKRKTRGDISENLRTAYSQENKQNSNRLFDEKTSQIYFGSTYAINSLSKPYKLTSNFKSVIHGGTNYYVAKDRDQVLRIAHPHGQLSAQGTPRNVLVAGVGIGQGLIPQTVCKDDEEILNKEKYVFEGINGLESSAQSNPPLSDFSSYKAKVKGIRAFPFNIMSQSSPIKTGYQRLVTENFKETAYITNLHSDTVDITNEIPIQGPFTETHVGGHQSRHVRLNKYDANLIDNDTGAPPLNNIDNLYTRPEAWRLLFGENPSEAIRDGALGFTPPDYGVDSGNLTYPDTAKKRATFYREEKAKRPLNIKNIKHNTSDNIAGNYNKKSEFISISSGRKENNFYFRKNSDLSNYLNAFYTASMPDTTHPFTLIAQDLDLGGNTFSKINNRQPDGETVPGQPSTGSMFVRSRLKAFDGDKILLGNGGSQKTIEISFDDNGVSAGAIALVTGSSNTEFWGNLKTALNTAGYSSSFSTFSQEESVNFKQDHIGSSITQVISSSLPSTFSQEISSYSFKIYASSSSNANGTFISTKNTTSGDYASDTITRQIVIDGSIFKVKWASKHNTNNNGYIAEKRYNNFWTGRTGAWLDLTVTFRTVNGESPVFGDVQVYVNGQVLTADSEIDGGGVIAGGTSTYTRPIVDEFYFAFHEANSGAGTRLTEIHVAEMAFHAGAGFSPTEFYNQSQYYDYTHNEYYDLLNAYFTFGNGPNDSITGATSAAGTLTVCSQIGDHCLLGTTVNNRWAFHTSSNLTQEDYVKFSITASSNSQGKNDLSFSLDDNSSLYSEELEAAHPIFFFEPLNGGVTNVNELSVEMPLVTPLLNGNKNETVITTRFSAPGGIEVQSLGYLDIYSREYSVHNALPFRNLPVLGTKVVISGSTPGGGAGEDGTIRINNHLNRREGLKTLLTRPSGKFGVDSAFGSVSKTTYTTDGSFVKQHRNRSRRIELDGETMITASNYDNGWVSSLLPRSDFQYSWINNIISGSNFEGRQKIYGYAPFNGLIKDENSVIEAINFPSSSNFS